MVPQKKYKISEYREGDESAKRAVLVNPRSSARQITESAEEGEMIMTFPEVVMKGIIAFELLVILLAAISLAVDAPLEWIANPEHTPNPAKAPWYFLGLQELLHYFPPVVAGVLLPALAVIALIAIPYFHINKTGAPVWSEHPTRAFLVLTAVVVAIGVLMTFFGAHAISIPTLLVYGLMVIPYFSKRETGIVGRLRRVSLASWIMSWFLLVAFTLTAIGTLFRGPEWRWIWPWIDGIY